MCIFILLSHLLKIELEGEISVPDKTETDDREVWQ